MLKFKLMSCGTNSIHLVNGCFPHFIALFSIVPGSDPHLFTLLQELFKVISGHSLFGVVNGKCVDDPRSRASDVNSNSLLGLEVATNRDIIGIALANLIVSNLLES